MEELLELLKEIKEEIDYTSVDDLVTGGYFESLDLLTVIADIEEHFKIDILASDIIPENFDSADAMWHMILSKK